MAVNGMSYIPVVYHRWFDTGEGWAFHPVLSSSLHDIMIAVEKPLMHRTQGQVRIPVGNKILLGEMLPDDNCKDIRARGRHPFIFRAVFADVDDLKNRRHDEILSRLKQILPPVGPGKDPTLEIELKSQLEAAPQPIDEALPPAAFVPPPPPLPPLPTLTEVIPSSRLGAPLRSMSRPLPVARRASTASKILQLICGCGLLSAPIAIAALSVWWFGVTIVPVVIAFVIWGGLSSTSFGRNCVAVVGTAILSPFVRK
jgi:hypothetical protein